MSKSGYRQMLLAAYFFLLSLPVAKSQTVIDTLFELGLSDINSATHCLKGIYPFTSGNDSLVHTSIPLFNYK